ncbi:hypothetical protein Aph01nite_77790 [Acrocarpospora phusangensis]|uniref:SGNH hydrolase-type esterase domain-containing protein n=1 Tax=Acrocarpospora phusangensis TaxID=1070424 RepID=A0A919QJV9_9ACTN|nr:SGNH/GDSL hydrolase family protein [Acrocarpospora phusangensis]GIH29469.1 hypothetical protein Aph01nite_77790 [Acrocarpospora phusangensis]
MRAPKLVSWLSICGLVTGCASAVGEAAAVPAPLVPPAAPVVMFVGDSFAVGSGPVRSWETYSAETARLLGWQLITAGGRGAGFVARGKIHRTFGESFTRELAWRPEPNLVVLAGGHNDRRAAPKVRTAATRLISRVKERWPRARIVVVGPIWLKKPPKAAYKVRDAVAKAAWLAGVPFADPLTQKWARTDVLPDGTHPTAAGHDRLARWLVTTLRSRGVAPERGGPKPLQGPYQGP